MGLVHDHGVAPTRDGFAPLRRLGLVGRVRRVGRACFAAGDGQQAPHHERELLQRGDHDLRAVDEGLGQLSGVFVDGLDDALGVLDLVDGVLQLAIQDAPVGDDQHAVVDLVVGAGVQARQAVGEPGDAVGLAAARGVLDQIVAPGPRVAGGLDEPVDGVELVVAREDERLALGGARSVVVVDLLVAGLDEQV